MAFSLHKIYGFQVIVELLDELYYFCIMIFAKTHWLSCILQVFLPSFADD